MRLGTLGTSLFHLSPLSLIPYHRPCNPLTVYRLPSPYVRPHYGVPLLASLDRGR
jgi:hypothetical protein